MKKILLTLIALVTFTAVDAKVIKITMKDKTTKVFTSSELSAIDFNEDGTTTITSYNGEILAQLSAEVEDVEVSDEAVITEIKEITMEFNPDLVNALTDLSNGGLATLDDVHAISSRPAHQVNFVYPTVDPWGEPITMSGCMFIPDNIWNAEVNSEGVILFNHFTTTSNAMLPSQGMAFIESWFLANPLMPNYIIVESDFYGWGATVRFPQAYMQGDVNGRASNDALLAARRLLGDLSIGTGILNFNVGYSSGGFDALATQRVRDMEHPYEICFDKTFAGGSASDLKTSYSEIIKVDTTGLTASVPMLIVATNETQKLGLNYADVFAPDIAAGLDELLLSKKYGPFIICRYIGTDRKIHDMFTSAYNDLESAESKALLDVYENISLTNGWLANPSQRIYVYHSRLDDVAPIQSARSLLKYLKEYGYEPSIIPGATNLQTNYVVPTGHMKGMLPWFVQTVAAIKAWPLMYYKGELNETYKFLADQSKDDPVAIMRYFDAMGFDCRGIVNQLLAMDPNIIVDGKVDLELLKQDLDALCQLRGITLNDLNEMMEDSGIQFDVFLMELVDYLNENPDTDVMRADIRSIRSSKNELTNPVETYENQLYDWLEANGVK